MQAAGAGPELAQSARDLHALTAMPVGDRALRIDALGITRITAEPELTPKRVVFSFDLDGRLGPVAVSALGVERVPMRWEGGRYAPAGLPLPRLAQVLERLRPALDATDGGAAVGTVYLRVGVKRVEVTVVRVDRTRRALDFALVPDGGLAPLP